MVDEGMKRSLERAAEGLFKSEYYITNKIMNWNRNHPEDIIDMDSIRESVKKSEFKQQIKLEY